MTLHDVLAGLFAARLVDRLLVVNRRVVVVGAVVPLIESVKGSGNSAFLEKDQLCYLKRAEKLTFCISFSQDNMQNWYLFC